MAKSTQSTYQQAMVASGVFGRNFMVTLHCTHLGHQPNGSFCSPKILPGYLQNENLSQDFWFFQGSYLCPINGESSLVSTKDF